MSFAITGFGGEQLRAQPQAFQALALAGQRPLAPASPYGTPNQQLVPVSQAAHALPGNLTVAAAPVFQAILNLGVVGVSRPGITSPPYSTAAVGAKNPGVQDLVLGPVSGPQATPAPAGPVSFSLTATPAYITSGLAALTSSPASPVHTSGKGDPPSGDPPAPAAPQTVPVSDPATVARITATVKQLAVAAVYPAPVFSFSV